MSTQVVWPLQQDVRSGGAFDEQQTLAVWGGSRRNSLYTEGTPEPFAVICSFA